MTVTFEKLVNFSIHTFFTGLILQALNAATPPAASRACVVVAACGAPARCARGGFKIRTTYPNRKPGLARPSLTTGAARPVDPNPNALNEGGWEVGLQRYSPDQRRCGVFNCRMRSFWCGCGSGVIFFDGPVRRFSSESGVFPKT